MADKKYQVFISSTYSDLVDERRKILDILLMADCIPAGMEAFVASDVEQFEVIKKVIQLCDYYILILGKRYGSINPKTGLSYTEMEYEYAKELEIPVLVFAMDESVDVPAEKTETEKDKIIALNKFRAKALDSRLARIWKTPDELTGAVAIAIMRAKASIQRPGWQRATDYDEAALMRQIMELQREKSKLAAELNAAKKELIGIGKNSNIAFEDCPIKVSYVKSNGLQGVSYGHKEVLLTTIFKIIATEMMEVSVNEEGLSDILRKKIFQREWALCSFEDPQFVKQILNQFKALGLVMASWNPDRTTLFWELTEKGEQIRDDMLLIKKHSNVHKE